MSRTLNAISLNRSFWTAVGILLFAAGVSGCASFKEVSAFATLSLKAASYDGLTRDYIGTLDRRKQYQPEKFHRELEAQKTRREAQRASLDLLQQTMTDYMQVLDGLASAEVRTHDEPLRNLADNLNRATLLDFNESEAVGALSTILARTVTAAYRLHELRKLIYDGNPPLQEVIRAARRIVEKGIVADLRIESVLVERYYDNFMLSPDNPAEPVAMALARETRVEALGRVDNRIRSAQSYAAVLEKIAQGHQYLFDHRESIGDEELDKQFQPHIDELRMAYKNLLDVSR